MTLLYVMLSVFPIIKVESVATFALKISLVIVLANVLGAAIYLTAQRRRVGAVSGEGRNGLRARNAERRQMPNSAKWQRARNAKRREMPNGAECRTAQNAERRADDVVNSVAPSGVVWHSARWRFPPPSA